MTKLLNILKKEFLQLVRTPALLAILILSPIITVGLVPFGLGSKVRVKAEVVDKSFSNAGYDLVSQLAVSKHIESVKLSTSEELSLKKIERGEIDAVVVIPADGGKCVILADASHIITGQNAVAYIARELAKAPQIKGFEITTHIKYATGEDNTHYYLVSMIVLLIAIVGCCLSSLSVVNERDGKILEHFRSTGLKASTYVGSKVLFFTLVGLAEMIVGLILARTIFHLNVAGSYIEYFFLGICFIYAMVNLGMLIALRSKSLVQAIYVLVFLFMIMILLSTMFAPLDNMSPFWAATRFVNPFFWVVDGSWKIALKGMGLSAIWSHYLLLIAMGAVMQALNILKINNTH
ncbi:MAG: ABC transporter permease [Bacteroidales bacterium]|nr:ABC transporter permease [Bacteroidales bacterium]